MADESSDITSRKWKIVLTEEYGGYWLYKSEARWGDRGPINGVYLNKEYVDDPPPKALSVKFEAIR